MIAWDALGYLASALVLGAFSMKEMILLRVVAVRRIGHGRERPETDNPLRVPRPEPNAVHGG
jgi:hypothetical protein